MTQTLTQTSVEFHRHTLKPPTPTPKSPSKAGGGPQPEPTQDFEQFLLACAKERKFPTAMDLLGALTDQEKVLRILMYGDEQRVFRKQFIHPAVLYMAVTGKPRPRLERRGRDFADPLFNHFYYNVLCGAGVKAYYKKHGVLLKEESQEMVKVAGRSRLKNEDGQGSEVYFYKFRFSSDQADRQDNFFETKKAGTARSIKAMSKAFGDLDRSKLGPANQLRYDNDKKLVELLERPALTQLLKPLELPLKSGALGDPSRK